MPFHRMQWVPECYAAAQLACAGRRGVVFVHRPTLRAALTRPPQLLSAPSPSPFSLYLHHSRNMFDPSDLDAGWVVAERERVYCGLCEDLNVSRCRAWRSMLSPTKVFGASRRARPSPSPRTPPPTRTRTLQRTLPPK